ncbi:hypothetical protein GCM10029963_19150 [Micromonospora andamanensis]
MDAQSSTRSPSVPAGLVQPVAATATTVTRTTPVSHRRIPVDLPLPAVEAAAYGTGLGDRPGRFRTVLR